MRYDRLISSALVALGTMAIAAGVFADVNHEIRRSLFGWGLTAVAFSLAGILWPRSNEELKSQTTGFLRFAALAVAVFSVVVLSIFLALGAPIPVSEELMMLAFTIGLPLGLIAPILAKHLILRKSNR